MAEPRFVNSSDLSPFDIADYKYSQVAQVLGRAWYYEWNDKDQQWAKLNERDPAPPADLKPGRFDGQIIEVPRTT